MYLQDGSHQCHDLQGGDGGRSSNALLELGTCRLHRNQVALVCHWCVLHKQESSHKIGIERAHNYNYISYEVTTCTSEEAFLTKMLNVYSLWQNLSCIKGDQWLIKF